MSFKLDLTSPNTMENICKTKAHHSQVTARSWRDQSGASRNPHVQPKRHGAIWYGMAHPCNCTFSLYIEMMSCLFKLLRFLNHACCMVLLPCTSLLHCVLTCNACHALPPGCIIYRRMLPAKAKRICDNFVCDAHSHMSAGVRATFCRPNLAQRIAQTPWQT
jgi:hypothetical protein